MCHILGSQVKGLQHRLWEGRQAESQASAWRGTLDRHDPENVSGLVFWEIRGSLEKRAWSQGEIAQLPPLYPPPTFLIFVSACILIFLPKVSFIF